MLVQRIQCYHYNEAFKIPFHSPQINRLRADSVIVCIDCGPDGCGWGESAPRSYVTGEDIQSVLSLWQDVFAPILFEQTFNSLEDIEYLLSQLEDACLNKGHRAYHSALGAADLALIDVLRGPSGLEGQQLFTKNYRKSLRYSVSVPFIDFSVIESFFPILNARFDKPIIKLLIGRNSEDNFKRFQLMRRLAGDAAEFRLEINGRLERHQVIEEIERLRPFRPVAIEQPLPADDIEGLCQLRQDSGLAVVVDESLVSLEDAKMLLAKQACDIFNIKISKCGGLIRSRTIAQLAAQAGVDCQVGTHVGESDLLGAAGLILARGIPNFDCYGGGSYVLFSKILKEELTDRKPDPQMSEDDSDNEQTPPTFPFLNSTTRCLDLQRLK